MSAKPLRISGPVEIRPLNIATISPVERINRVSKEVKANNKGVKIMGETNILNKLPSSASNLYAKNLFNFVLNLFNKEEKKIKINLEDEIIEKTLIK